MRIFWILCLVALGVDFNALANQPQCLIQQARQYIGLKETPGRNNRGPELDRLVLSVQGKPGLPWCGYFMMRVHQLCQVKGGGGMAMTWFPSSLKISKPMPGDVFSVWNRYLNRIGHVGLIEQVLPSGNVIVTIEGNTNAIGKREGSGVCRLTRPVKQVYSFARWWK